MRLSRPFPFSKSLAALSAALAIHSPQPSRAAIMEGPGFGELDEASLLPAPNSELSAALGAIESGDLATGQAKVAAFLQNHPDSAAGHEISGIAKALAGDLDGGMAAFVKAVELEPRRITAITKTGDIHLARKRLPEAKAAFQQALAFDPTDRHANQRMGEIFEAEENHAEAMRCYEKGIEGTPPGYVGVKVNLGGLYNRQRRFTETIRLLEPVVPADTKNENARMVLAVALIGRGEPGRAAELLEKSPAANSGHFLALGIAHRDAGQLEPSRAALEKALAEKPDWAIARFQLAETLAAMKKVPDAMEAYRAALSGPNPVLTRNRMAELAAGNGMTEEAANLFNALISEGLADARTYSSLATMLQLEGRMEDAEKALAAACAKFPGNPRVIQRMAMHHAVTRDYPRAAAELEKALQLAPADPSLLKAMSLVALRRGDTAQAVERVTKLLELVPDSAEDRFYLGTLLESQGQDSAAEKAYVEVLGKKPDHVATLNNLAELRMRNGNGTSALELATKAARLEPEIASIRNTLGWIKFKTGDAAGARGDLEAAIAGENSSPAHRYRLAEFYAETGEQALAKSQLDAALASPATFAERPQAEKLADKLAATVPAK